MSWQIRSNMLLGETSAEILAQKHVLVMGVGGVGSYAVEALARSGIGRLTLCDGDTVADSNRNRQLVALTSTLGLPKAEVAAARVRDINPSCEVTVLNCFYTPENADALPLAQFDYIVDAIDMMTSKLELICRAKAADTPILCALGCGNKLDPTRFVVTDLYKTTTDPMAKILRHELRRKGVDTLKVVFSTEPARTPLPLAAQENGKRTPPGSTPFVPGVAGLILASEVVKDLLAL